MPVDLQSYPIPASCVAVLPLQLGQWLGTRETDVGGVHWPLVVPARPLSRVVRLVLCMLSETCIAISVSPGPTGLFMTIKRSAHVSVAKSHPSLDGVFVFVADGPPCDNALVLLLAAVQAVPS